LRQFEEQAVDSDAQLIWMQVPQAESSPMPSSNWLVHSELQLCRRRS